jgi:hypothetical protein
MKSWSFFVLSFSPWLDGTKNTLENGSKYGSPETWTIEKKNILPSFFPVPKCSTYPQNFKMIPQIVNRSSTKARFRFRGLLCDGQNTGYAPILRKTMVINPIS